MFPGRQKWHMISSYPLHSCTQKEMEKHPVECYTLPDIEKGDIVKQYEIKDTAAEIIYMVEETYNK